MTQPCLSTCSVWATSADVCDPCTGYDMDATLLDDALVIASDILFELSGRQFPGNCQDAVRPCGSEPYDDRGWAWPTVGYGRRRWGFGACGSCGCEVANAVSLGAYPVTSIVEVKVDGAVLDSSLYRVDDWRWLVRLADPDGTNPGWPHCQRLDLADTEVGSWAVTFTYGMSPPPGGVRAAASLACQLALLCQPETVGECRLSPRVTSLDRQGLSIVVSDPAQFFPEGRTGLPEVDLWIRSVNSAGISRRAAVLSPDIGPRTRRVGT